jgi:hypothetical protein
MAKQINKVKKPTVMKSPANPVKQPPVKAAKESPAIPADEAAANVRRFIDRGMSDNSIWAELEASGFTSKKLGQFFVTEIRKGGSPEKKPPHRPYPPKAPRG